MFLSPQYVSEVVIGAPYAVGKDLLDHFKVTGLFFGFLFLETSALCPFALAQKELFSVPLPYRSTWCVMARQKCSQTRMDRILIL